jgi:hypothetical protein
MVQLRRYAAPRARSPRPGAARRRQDLDDLGRRYRAMGIRVLWIAEFDEIPGLLASIADPEAD